MQKVIIKKCKSPFDFDRDQNGAVAFTEHNAKFVRAILSMDSRYKNAENGGEGSAQKYIKDSGISNDYSTILKQVQRVDKENGTHLNVLGKGHDQMAKAISETKNLKTRLKSGDPELVNELSMVLKPERDSFSFASKYCTYLSRYALELDNYCIYDSILSEMLPYYAYTYCGEKWFRPGRNGVVGSIGNLRGHYKEYRDLINRIRDASYAITDYNIPLKEFDHVIWYSYKGKANIDERKRVLSLLK